MSSSLRGRVVAITGAARGIGLTIAKALQTGGAKVAIGDLDERELERAAAELGGVCHARMDVTDPDSFRAFLTQAEAEAGPLDALVNNAGIMPTGPLLEEDDAITRRVIEINTLGFIFGTKLALELMVPRGRGHVVNIASTMGEAAVPGLATYNASKAAVLLFSDAVRLEHRRSGVSVSVILPGAVKTELGAGIKGPRGIPAIEPEDVADAVVRTLEGGTSRPRVYVPRLFGALLTSRRMLPRSLGEALNRALGAETAVLRESDLASRAAYEERVAAQSSNREG